MRVSYVSLCAAVGGASGQFLAVHPGVAPVTPPVQPAEVRIGISAPNFAAPGGVDGVVVPTHPGTLLGTPRYVVNDATRVSSRESMDALDSASVGFLAETHRAGISRSNGLTTSKPSTFGLQNALGVISILGVVLAVVGHRLWRKDAVVAQPDRQFEMQDVFAPKFAVAACAGDTNIAAALAMKMAASRPRIGGAGQRSMQWRQTLSCKGEEVEAPAEEELSDTAKASIEILQADLEKSQALLEEKKDSYARLKNEVDNFRTRTRSELATARGQAAVPVVKEFLPICDEFDLAKQNLKIEGEGEQAIADRFDELFDKLMTAMNDAGVAKLESVGQDFDPEFHEAISMIPSVEYKEDVVCNEARAGWVLKASGADTPQVLRPALVCVSSGPGPS